MDAKVWARIKALRPAAPRVLWSAAGYMEVRTPEGTTVKKQVSIDGTYKNPHNIRRLRKQAVKDFGIRQFKRVGAQREFNILMKKEGTSV